MADRSRRGSRPRLRRVAGCWVIVISWLLVGCDAREPSPPAETAAVTLRPVAFSDLPGWAGDRTAEARPALRATCTALGRKSAGEPVGPRGMAGTAGDWQAACSALAGLEPSHAVLREYLEAWFVPFAVGAA